ncbi:hypothetical protein K9O30_10355 [Clostridium bowmanii]|uniref:hypothetical protein n=1 Tax=Clostridium bowmanii TaxID=132925 RepID=UPI001C0D1EFB|nr:hypothetical protein [Clostridium bowmanii]MBU3189501.1 hypothetical protein [Clostridium bowmanii]MCA1074114.1 hypothetical protein [Clostridium bowmanii]
MILSPENRNIFNKLMINAIKTNEDEFQFDGDKYMVCSDGVCVQTLIDDKILYRIYIEEDKYNNLINH